jgi:hypothetical protein
LARSGNTFWVIPGELTQAISTISEAFGDYSRMGGLAADQDSAEVAPPEMPEMPTEGGGLELTSGTSSSLEPSTQRIAELTPPTRDAAVESAAVRGGNNPLGEEAGP